MNGSAQQVGKKKDCIVALGALVTALHQLIADHPEFRDRLLPATIQLSEAISALSTHFSQDLTEIDDRLHLVEERLVAVERGLAAVEERLRLLEVDMAQLKTDVAQLRTDVALVKLDMAQIKKDISEQKDDIKQLKASMLAVQTSQARLEEKFVASEKYMADIFATKEDLLKQTWRIYGAMATLTAAVYFIARYVH